MFKEILAKINNTFYCRREDFKAKKYHNRQLEEIPQFLRPIGVNEWEKLGWPEHFKKWFSFRTKYLDQVDKHGRVWGRQVFKGYHFSFPWMFDLKVEPHFLTHYQKIDPDIESKLDIIHHTLWRNKENAARLTKLKGWRGRMADEWCRAVEWHRAYDRILNEQMKEWEEPFDDPYHDWK